jgi:hypothetical protein
MMSKKIVQTRLVHLWTRYQVLMVDAAVMATAGKRLAPPPFQDRMGKDKTYHEQERFS